MTQGEQIKLLFWLNELRSSMEVYIPKNPWLDNVKSTIEHEINLLLKVMNNG